MERPPSPLPLLQPATFRAARLSITDRCDLACQYCRPSRADGYVAAERRLDPDAWARLAEGLVARGVTRLRLTGGEPLLHPRVVEIVRALSRVEGVTDLALTTNGTRLSRLAPALRDAGLRRVNVSIDSLDPARFGAITRGGRLDEVLRGVDAATAAGFEEIKSNTVVLGPLREGDLLRNDDELEAIVRWAWSKDITPRFIELMPIGEGARLEGRAVPFTVMRERLAHLMRPEGWRRPEDRGPARYLSASADPRREVGFITGASDTFCSGCDRLRVASDGALRPCLAKGDAVDLGGALDGDGGALQARLDEAARLKPDGRRFGGCTEAAARAVSMRAMGG